MNVFAALQAAYPADRARVAIETDTGLLYTWQDIDRASAMLANLLTSLDLHGRTLEDGTFLPPVVAAHTEKSVEALLLYLATLRAGMVYLPLNPAYRQAEMDYFLGDAQPAVVVCAPGDFQWLSRVAFQKGVRHVFTLGTDRTGTLLDRASFMSDQHRPEVIESTSLCAILYTSGTTGRSKGALLTHGNLLSNARTLIKHWAWQPTDVLLHALPIFHIHGLFVACHCALLSGSKLLWLGKFEPQAVLQRLPQATVFMGVPTMYGRLLAQPGLTRSTCGGMRLFVSGSAPLLPSVFADFAQRTGHTILERYGMSETGMLCSNPYRPEAGPRLAGSVGPALPGVEVRVVDDAGAPCPAEAVGHIQVRGPNVFMGYLGMPDKTAESFTDDDWFKTGDVGKVGSNNYVTIVGRARDLIITGGFNVYPAEIEDHLNQLPGVAESAVFGVPHPDFGEGVVAAVVPQPGAHLTEAGLIEHTKQRIANFKVPKRVFVLAELPRNAMGKVQKNLLQKEHAALFGSAGG
jgi:malonyl-CoA/methylmalonyl-CoA synthetase